MGEVVAADSSAADDVGSMRRRRSRGEFIFYAVLALISAGLFAYALTLAFVWDEGFHLLAAELINHGEKPYIDFAFPQTILNAYWNAALMHAFGQNWRVTHAGATVWASGAVLLIAFYMRQRFPVEKWRIAAALLTACFLGFNLVVYQFATVSQAYGIGLFLVVAGFCATTAAVTARGVWLALLGGLCVGAAADSTLLTAPAVIVLFVWLCLYNESGTRTGKSLAFIAGVLVAFIPVLWLFAQAPKQTFFNVFEYQALFRRVNWGNATLHDVDVLSDWLDSLQTFVIGGFAVIGVISAYRERGLDRRVRREFLLVLWLAVGLILYISTAHPTFGRYYVFAIPFMAVLAAIGSYVAAVRLGHGQNARWPTLVLCGFMALTLGKQLLRDRESQTWGGYQEIANKVKQVTPSHKLFLADELVYFLLRVRPPTGMEFSYAHKLQLPTAEERLYHIVSNAELKRQIENGRFATVENCKDDTIKDWRLDDLFPNRADMGDCSVYWGPVQAQPEQRQGTASR
jgi:hypothetical protein